MTTVPLPLPIEEIYINALTVNTLKATLCSCDSGTGTGGSTGLIGIPTDGTFGTYNPPGVLPTDTVADALDKTITLIESLLPVPPPALSAVTITLSDPIYSAYVAGTTTLRTNVQDNASFKPITEETDAFGDAKLGVTTAIVDGVPNGAITMTDGDDTGTIDGYLTITDDSDYYIGVPGKEGIFYAIKATVGGTASATALTPGDIEHSYQISYDQGSGADVTNILTFRQDNASTLTASVDTTTVSPQHGIYSVNWVSGTRVSGVPVLSTADSVDVRYSVSGVIGKFYNSTQVGRAISAYTTSQSELPSGPAEGSTLTFTATLYPLPNSYTPDLQIICEAYKSPSITPDATAAAVDPSGDPIIVDTRSQEPTSTTFIAEVDRKDSISGEFPSYNRDPFDPNESLIVNEELQLINGLYQYPPAVDYTGNLPAGPDYTSVPSGSFNNVRWLTFESIPIVASDDSLTIIIHNPQGTWNFEPFTDDIIVSDFYLQIKVYDTVGNSDVTGWLDANSPFNGSPPAPSADGNPVVAIAQSLSYDERNITFGTGNPEGTIVVRVGLPEGSDKKFSGIEVIGQ